MRDISHEKNCWEVNAFGACKTILGDDSCPVCKESKLNGANWESMEVGSTSRFNGNINIRRE